MPLPVSQPENDFKPAPAGMHHAVCYCCVWLGSTYSEKYDTWTDRVLVIWELPNVRQKFTNDDGVEQDLPMTQSKFYTRSLHEKSNLYKDLITWRGVNFTKEELLEFDLFNIIGANCQVQIMHDEKGKAKVLSIMPLTNGMNKLPPEHEIIKYSIQDDGLTIPANISDGIKKMIMASREIEQLQHARSVMGGQPNPDYEENPKPPTDDIPF